MIFLKRLIWPALAAGMVLMTLVACEEDLTTIGDGLVGSEPFTSSKKDYEVFAFNKEIEAVQTNRLPIYQLGVYNDPFYGRTEASITAQLRLSTPNPSFGIFSQAIEDNPNPDSASQINEEEKIKEVFLYIPYITKDQLARDMDNDGVDDVYDDEPSNPNNDDDGDGISNTTENANGTDPLDPTSSEVSDENPANTFPKRIDIDSIYGNRNQTFTLKIERSTFFLRDLDPNANFQQVQSYYSDDQFSPNFVSDVLFEDEVSISDREILIFDEDDPDTEIDESKLVETRLNPGIRVALDTTFFRDNFLNKEGDLELLSQNNFNDFFRGMHISLSPSDQELMFLLDLAQANVTVTYDFKRIDVNETPTTTDDEEVIDTRDYVFTFLDINAQLGQVNGNAVNTLNRDPFPSQIATDFDPTSNASRIYLKGGAGSYSELRLFDGDAGAINEIKENNWIVNEANLVFYVDRTTVDAAGMTPGGDDQPLREPSRLYLYNTETGLPLINYLSERTTAENLFGSFLNYDGVVQLNGQGKADRYSIKITDHINNLVVRDSANVPLALTMTSDIGRIGRLNARVQCVNSAMNECVETPQLPVISTMTPVGTVLFGSNPGGPDSDKRLKLEIFYTEAN